MSRSANYSIGELNTLLDCLESRRELLNETGNKLTLEQQRSAWEQVASLVNQVSHGVTRTGSKIKNKWHDIKYRTKLKVAKVKAHQQEYPNWTAMQLSDLEQRILRLLNTSGPEGIVGQECDSALILGVKQEYDTDQDSNSVVNNDAEISDHCSEPITVLEENLIPVCSKQDEIVHTELINTRNSDSPNETQPPWPFAPLTDGKSTVYVKKHRDRKRRLVLDQDESIEKKIIETQEWMAATTQESAHTQQQILETLQQISTSVADIKVVMEKNIKSQNTLIRLLCENMGLEPINE